MTVWAGAPGGGTRLCGTGDGWGEEAGGRAAESDGRAAWWLTAGELQAATTAAIAAAAALRAAFIARRPSLERQAWRGAADHMSRAA